MKKRIPSGKLFCARHSVMQVAQVCLENFSPHQFCSTANNFPDLVSLLHVQIRLMGNCGFNGGISWLSSTGGAHWFFSARRVSKTSVISFRSFRIQRENFKSVWAYLNRKIMTSNPIDGAQIANFISSLDRHQKALLLLTSLLIKQLPLSLHQILIHCCF